MCNWGTDINVAYRRGNHPESKKRNNAQPGHQQIPSDSTHMDSTPCQADVQNYPKRNDGDHKKSYPFNKTIHPQWLERLFSFARLFSRGMKEH